MGVKEVTERLGQDLQELVAEISDTDGNNTAKTCHRMYCLVGRLEGLADIFRSENGWPGKDPAEEVSVHALLPMGEK